MGNEARLVETPTELRDGPRAPRPLTKQQSNLEKAGAAPRPLTNQRFNL